MRKISSNKITRWLRILVLVGLLLLVTYEAYMHQVQGGGKAPSVHALCPLGALESLFTLLFMGSFIQKIYSGTVVLLVLTVVIAILFRRSFCGLLCPFGALQELFARLGQKIFKKRYIISKPIDKRLRYLKYLLLALTVGMAWYYGTLWMSPYDPYVAYTHLTDITGSIEEDPKAIIGYILLAVTVIGSLLYDRFFCKYLCPVGALYGILGKVSPTRIERNENLCINCNICNKACPVNIDVAKTSKITNAECISCNECVTACPKKGALEVKTINKVVKPVAMLGMVVVLFFGTILIAQATGNYRIIPEPLKKGEIISIADIKGYYTIEEAVLATGLSLQEIYSKMGIPAKVSKDTMMKEISKTVDGFNFDEAKTLAGSTQGAASEVPVFKEIDPSKVDSNKIDVTGVKGSITIREAASVLKMEIKDFYKLFKIPENVPAQTRMKDIGNVSPGYEFEKIKESLK